MIIVNNTANFANAPAFGLIANAENLIFGLRVNSLFNTVNLSNRADRAAITKNTAEYSTDGMIGRNGKFLLTNFVPTSPSLTIKSIIKLIDMPLTGAILGIFGDHDGTNGTAMMMTTVANGTNFDYELRIYVAAKAGNGATVLRLARYKFAVNQKLSTTGLMNVWAKIDDNTDTVSIKVDGNAWVDVKFTGDNLSARNDAAWQIGAVPKYTNTGNAGVIIKELLIWNKALTATEIAQQNELSNIWQSI